MANWPVPVGTITASGVLETTNPTTPTTAAATDTYTLATNNGLTTFVEIGNAATTAARTITIVTPGTVGGGALAIADATFSLTAAANAVIRIGPLDPNLYGANPVLTVTGGVGGTVQAWQI